MAQTGQIAPEEFANALSHGLAFIAALASAPVLVVEGVRSGSAMSVVGVSIFAATMLLLYLSSTIFHALPAGRAKQIFMRLDHGAIYLFIAGTYTPLALRVAHDAAGWAMFVAVWLLAFAGVIAKVFDRLTHPILSTGLYVCMGWFVLLAAYPLVAHIPKSGLVWLVAGGVAYTAGVAFFAAETMMRYGHLVWHLFVMGGTTCHFLAVFRSTAA